MKKVICFLTLLVVGGVVSGCEDRSTPQGILSMAYSSLEKGDATQFRSLLDGRAKQEFSNIARVQELKQKLSSCKFGFGEPVQTGAKPVPRNDGEEWIDRAFEIDIIEQGETNTPFITAKVSCLAIKTRCSSNQSHPDARSFPCWEQSECRILDLRS